ncbi:Zinc finger protein ZAT2 [Sesamum alatum]|uniref:Zinc finger protein ZAT2 n=1 Tax=Sesamum alatum TaxID=300844 RepID=A0AAE2CA28_9LAMI|nr:Zinc finger protein ZAT2 [Sesamum alatum]
MACIDQDQQPNFKHYCRVCKKGFMCGRALGGHMRAHGIGDENGNIDDDDPVSDWEDKLGERTSNKRMYQLRTNPNRLKSCRTCENCGKEFLSWKSFLEHGKCSSDDASESLVSSPDQSDGEDDGGGRRGGGWSKRKRSLRSKVGCLSSHYPPSEEDDLLLARCLVQLANTRVDPPVAVEPEESCASASREEERRNAPTFLGQTTNRAAFDHKAKGVSSSPRGLFECKACKKVFNSHQALGGHRASHKKVKGCYAAKQDQVDENSTLAADDDVITNNNNEEFLPSKSASSLQFEQGPAALVGAARRKSKVHECSICHRVFTSGQALGGHKRCHWITSNAPDTSSLPKFHFQDTNNNIEPIQNHHQQQQHKPNTDASDKLDLNVPAWAHMSGVRRDPRNPLSFEVSTDMHLQPWNGQDTRDNKSPHCQSQQFQLKNENNNNNININKSSGKKNNSNNVSKNGNDSNNYVEDEADSKLKFAKLSDLNDLKDMGTSGSSSRWLQVGIGSTTETAADA